MLQDEVVAELQALARRQAFSTRTTSESASQITSSSSLTSSQTQSTSTSSSVLDPSPLVGTLTGTESPPSWYCTAALPSGGVIRINDTFALTLGEPLSFQAPCGNHSVFNTNNTDTGNSTVIPYGDPFYASVSPQVYALAAATIISYVLVIILFITPRTFYVGGPGGSSTYYGGGASGLLSRGMTFMGSGGSSSGVVGVGRRPLLQKIAAITVAVSLTIATSDTFNVAKEQYKNNYMDASTLVSDVVGSIEIRVTRVISDAFLWLAQVQTLIRLFPRHKEKVTIKWLGFGMVTCDTVFSILENFVSVSNRTRPESFTDAIPALSYLFELAISLIYASCVIYYSLSKRRYAFWSSKMQNMCILALMSISAVLIPVVFFIVDVAQPDVATWGEYIRWVGAAAASVVVWEWVERIEALERDEKRDGILGREIFDGDEMLDSTPSNRGNLGGGVHFGSNLHDSSNQEKRPMWKDIRDLNIRPRFPHRKHGKSTSRGNEKAHKETVDGDPNSNAHGIARPPQVATPISRAETNSASTVYAVRYHNPLSPSPAIPENTLAPEAEPDTEVPQGGSDESTLTNTTNGDLSQSKRTSQTDPDGARSSGRQRWQSVSNPFKRKRAEPPAEVAAQITESNNRRSPATRPLNLRYRFNAFTAAQRGKRADRAQTKTPLGVTVIPAQPRLSLVRQSEDGVAKKENAPDSGPTPIPETEQSGNEASRKDSILPVTFIPPPIKGGRTWSPDDLYDTGSKSTPSAERNESSSETQRPSQSHLQPQTQLELGKNVTASSAMRHQSNGSPAFSTERNSTPTAQIRGNTPNRSVLNTSTGAQVRTSITTRDRGETIPSISDRLSTSPPTASNTPIPNQRSAPNDSVSQQGSKSSTNINVPAPVTDSTTHETQSNSVPTNTGDGGRSSSTVADGNEFPPAPS